jgi:serine/threonine protein kinase
MAEVFKAEHRHHGEIRGLKVLLPEIAAQPELLNRLLTEARTMARLRHPNIAEVYDFDVQGDSAFIVMEYLPGITLRTWCDHVGKLARNPVLAAAIAGTLADGLSFAHQHGVVHRDLKPENVLLTPVPEDEQGFAMKILDFGVAKLVREHPMVATTARLPDEPPLTETQHGCIVGTPLYMAPELWRAGNPVDHRADIYALGCVLFELLCGRPPFCESDTRGTRRAHLLDTPPDVTVLEPEIPARFQTLLARMLAKSPDDRHASMEDVLTQLETISGRPRALWSKVLRTPRAGAMAARGTLVINLHETMVDSPSLRRRLSLNADRLWNALPRRPSLSSLEATVRGAGRTAHRRWSALLGVGGRLASTRAARLAAIVGASLMVAGTLLWGGSVLLRRNLRPAPQLAVPAATLETPPPAARPERPGQD